MHSRPRARDRAADSLFISERSVMNHTRNVFLNLGVVNRTAAALLARLHGLAGTD
jgi:DNA-binding NarL/FixJ family response regulator